MQDKEKFKRVLQEAVERTNPAIKRDDDLPTAEEESEDIGPCASRVTVKPWFGMHVRNAKLIPDNTRTGRSIDFSHMGFREYDDAGNRWFIIEVNEPEKWRIRVEGCALWKIWNYIHQHRLEWISPVIGHAEMGIPDGMSVIERITIQRIEDGADDEPKGKKTTSHEKERRIEDDKPITW